MLRISQIGIMCRDIERSASFYRDILGLEEFARLGTEDHPVVVLKAGSLDLELMQASPLDKAYELLAPVGMNHFAFYVRKLDEVLSDLRNKGVKILDESKTVKNVRVAYIEDPDGVRIEFVEFSGERATR